MCRRRRFQHGVFHDVKPVVVTYQNAKENTPNTARIEHDKALARVMLSLLKDDTEIYKQFVQNESFKRFVADMVLRLQTNKYHLFLTAQFWNSHFSLDLPVALTLIQVRRLCDWKLEVGRKTLFVRL